MKVLEAARNFTQGEQEEEKGLAHKILLATYKLFRGDNTDRIHSYRLLNELHEEGIPSWIETSHLADYLVGYDPSLKPRQMKIAELNRNGYDWHSFKNSWNTYISETEVRKIEEELGLLPKVDEVDRVDRVDRVDTLGDSFKEVFEPTRLSPQPSTPSTGSTLPVITKGDLCFIPVASGPPTYADKDIYPREGSTRSTDSTSQTDGVCRLHSAYPHQQQRIT
jgi:hypothetical protein